MDPTKPMVDNKVTTKSVTVECLPFFSEVGADEEFGHMNVMVRVSASEELISRVPIDLLVVLDVAARKLDLLNRTMKFIMEQLHNGDRINVFVGNKASESKLFNTILDSTRKLARKSIAGNLLVAKGLNGTAFKPGLKEAVNILDGRSDKSRPGFILLLSDGDDKSQVQEWWNKRKADPAFLKLYPVHTLGMGAAHDDKLLFFIAQESGGTYSFVRDRHVSDIPEPLAVCLGGLKSIVAMDTFIKVTRGSEAVEIRGVEYHGTGFQGTLEKPYARFEVGTLYAGEVKSFIVKIYCKQCNAGQELRINAGVQYRDAADAKVTDSHKVTVRRLPVVYPDQHMPNPNVSRVLARLKVLEKLNFFVNTMIKESARQELLKIWRGLKPKNARIRLQFVDELDRDITAIANEMASDRYGAAYLYSWLSSYNMQRATTMGTPDNVVPEFLTPAMEDQQEAARNIP